MGKCKLDVCLSIGDRETAVFTWFELRVHTVIHLKIIIRDGGQKGRPEGQAGRGGRKGRPEGQAGRAGRKGRLEGQGSEGGSGGGKGRAEGEEGREKDGMVTDTCNKACRVEWKPNTEGIG